MADEEFTLEIPAGVTQTDVWQLEEDLSQTENVSKAVLYEKRDIGLINELIIVVPIVVKHVKEVVEVGANFKAAAKKLHEFLHSSDEKPKEDLEARKKVVMSLPDGTKSELYGYSVEELQELMATRKLPRKPKK